MDISLIKWHGDASNSIKQKALKNPQGVVLITPESFESLLMRKGLQAEYIFGGLTAIIIDELHAFIGTERGVQLQSLMNRLELILGRPVNRIGLSATFGGDMKLVKEYLRNSAVSVISHIDAEGRELKLQLRSYIQKLPNNVELQEAGAKKQIIDHIFKVARGRTNLIFAGNKASVEFYGSSLRDLCEKENLQNEFFTHHANISKSDREALENRLKKNSHPTTAVCTSTLELGIDIGDVETVIQIGCSGSVSSLRQRMGRSGRRNEPAILRAYNISYELNDKATIIDVIRPELVQAIAEIQLLLEGNYEPPSSSRIHLSTLVHQILSIIVERGGINAKNLFEILASSSPFNNISSSIFINVLRAMNHPKTSLIEQMKDGLLLLGAEGEKITSHYDFYAVFNTAEEFRVLYDGKNLGSLPVMSPTSKGTIIIFSGRRWQITEVDQIGKCIEVKPSKGGNPPQFIGDGLPRHCIIDEKMQAIYNNTPSEFTYIDSTSKEILQEGYSNFNRYNLDKTSIIQCGDDIMLFPWAGSSMISGLTLVFQHKKYVVENLKYAILIRNISQEQIHVIINQLKNGDIPDLYEMAQTVKNLSMGKYDSYLTNDLLIHQLISTLPSVEEFINCSNKLKI